MMPRFNITKYVKPGRNILACEVYRWTDGSYLEDQDIFPLIRYTPGCLSYWCA